MKNESLWQDGIEPLNLNKNIPAHLEVDTLIIGGGLAGISTLFELKDTKQKIALIDSGRIGFGVTSRTTGKLTYMQELCYQKLEKIFSFDKARLYYESQIEAIKLVKHYILQNKIDCNYEITDAYVFTNDEKEIPKFKKEEEFYNRIGLKVEANNELPYNIPVIYSLKAPNSAFFHPLKYLYSLAKIALNSGKNIYENVKAETVEKIGDKYQVTTDKNVIITTNLVVTTHYPFFVKPGFIPLRSHIENSFVLASKINEFYPIQMISSTKPTDSIRYHQDKQNKYFIYAGESSKPADDFDYERRMMELEEKELIKFKIKPDYTWHTHDVMTNDSLPFIGAVNKKNPNFYIVTGFNKWGMTNSVIAGKIIADLIKGNENKYVSLFALTRPINFEKIKNFFIDSYTNGKAIVKAKLIKEQIFYHNNVLITYEDGKRIGIYIDENGEKHKVRNLCPHMKCNLIFNNLDKTWDCPCHGSRFDIDGNVVEGPSVYSIKLDEK